MTGPHILCLGKDTSLLQTRLLVLQTRYLATYCVDVREAKFRWPGCPFDVLVLCHTMADEEIELAEAYAAERKPAASLLMMQTGLRTGSSRVLRAVRNLEGPEPLLRAIQDALQERPAL